VLIDLPSAELVERGQIGLNKFAEALEESGRDRFAALLADRPGLADELVALFAGSDFVSATAIRRPSVFLEFLDRRDYEVAFSDAVLDALMDEWLEPAGDFEALSRAVRVVRQLAQVHIIWRDFLRGDYEETVHATTRLADRLIGFCLGRLHGWLVERMGEPRSADDTTAQQMVVFALGKLGAEELNLSSDVDLIFAYPEPGQLRGSEQTNQAFFLRLAQQLVQVLDNVTADGFAFRVDMRLRPYGDSGALVLHFPALERYYEEQGRGWERYALIRARVCAGDRDAGAELLASLRPFVYRRYLDFGSLEALREMRARVDRERRAASMAHNIKLGPGGIRDVEFVVQMHQLTWGGRHPELQVARTLEAIRSLTVLALFSVDEAATLAEGYVFLRDAEHKLQGFDDAQTQLLPDGEPNQARLAWLMGSADYSSFVARLDVHRDGVAAIFRKLVDHGDSEGSAEQGAADQSSGDQGSADQWQHIWTDAGSDPTETEVFPTRLEPGAEAQIMDSLRRLRAARDKPAVGQEGRDRLDAIMPKLMECAFAGDSPVVSGVAALGLPGAAR
jgi:glutamate-ammonia-ligase adenylyltransferase